MDCCTSGSSSKSVSWGFSKIINDKLATAKKPTTETATKPTAKTKTHPDTSFKNLKDRCDSILYALHERIEDFRLQALDEQTKRDFLLLAVSLLRHNNLLKCLPYLDREEIDSYITRIDKRLGVVKININSLSSSTANNSLAQINKIIDAMITIGDAEKSRKICQQYLTDCRRLAERKGKHHRSILSDTDCNDGKPDYKIAFKTLLLDCALEDRKNIEKRLMALMDHLSRQIS